MNAEALELSGDLAEQLDESERDVGPISPDSIPLRYSRLKNIGRSALHYLHSCQSDREDTLAMRLGRGAHAMTLGTPVVKWPGKVRSGKAWETFKTLHPDAEILNRNEWKQAAGMSAAILAHPHAAPLLFGDGVIREQQLHWTLDGRACSGRPDAYLGNEYVVDVKTCQDANPNRYIRQATWSGVLGQLEFYSEALRAITGEPAKRLYIVAVESKAPYVVTVYELDRSARIIGEQQWRSWFERVRVCEQSNAYPGYSESIVSFKVDDDLGLTIGGVAFADLDAHQESE